MPWELHRSRPSMPIQALLLFCATYFFAILYCNHAFYRDPTSFFFNPATAYEPTYSMQRKHQAESFVAAANVSSLRSFEHAQKPPVVCIGISTIARLGGNQYVRSTIGSLWTASATRSVRAPTSPPSLRIQTRRITRYFMSNGLTSWWTPC
jgi:hypothetical protein